MKELRNRRSETLSRDLLEIMQLFLDASDNYAKDKCLNLAYECKSMAALFALQIQGENKNKNKNIFDGCNKGMSKVSKLSCVLSNYFFV